MATKTKYGSIKRFGARYGRTVKHKFGKVEAEQRATHVCPYCKKPGVKRIAVGIWYCPKEELKFTSRAYSVSKVKISEDA